MTSLAKYGLSGSGAGVSPDQPVLIAGPTASGKSALALAIAQAQGGVVINADASQVYDCWRIITACPSPQEEAMAPHALYRHTAFDAPYSAGHWLREVAPLLNGDQRPIVVGGTGLNFAALTQGLADIPATPPRVRAQADEMELSEMLSALDPVTTGRLDVQNRMRVQRAWEVQRATGRGLALWQDATPPPLLPANKAACLVMTPSKDWLNARIERRFNLMLDAGAMAEIAAMDTRFDPALPACRAIGVPELMALHRGALDRSQAIERAVIATRQYAKRQRTWFRSKMRDWQAIDPSAIA